MNRHRSRWTAGYPLAAVVVAGLTAAGPAAHAAPPDRPASVTASPFLGEGHGPRDEDNRAGTAAPDATQRAMAGRLGAVPWNTLGTPRALGPGAALATGLSADPDSAARQYLVGNHDLYGFDAATVAAMDTVLVQPIGDASVVTLRQRFGDLPAGHDGLVSILVSHGSVIRVTSSLSRDTRAPQPATLSASEAVDAALADAGLSRDRVQAPETRQVAVPTPLDGPRAAYLVTLISTDTADPAAYNTYVDARTGRVLVREDLVDFDSDNPTWAVFPATAPRVVKPGTDPRVHWCLHWQPGCVKTVSDPVSGQAWDVDLTTGAPTGTSVGNSANDTVRWGGTSTPVNATPSPDREYTYPFTDQWQAARCDPAGFASAQRNDADAAVTNLFAMHNSMHDFAYHLGFTEATWNLQAVNLSGAGKGADAEQGRAQSGALTGSRNNANQGTGADGLPPTTNMFLWQPQAGAAYPPCVDGDYDMTVIGHEYTHAITNRMIAGPDSGITSFQGGAMGEAWGDLTAVEYLAENGLRAPGATPFVVGAYVTGNDVTGIRDYDGSRSPLNYSDVGFDLVGPEVHADGEIWVATNLRVRDAFVKRYGTGNALIQRACAQGAIPVTACPGNRRWIQLMFDSYLLEADSQFSMLDMRDNMLAADVARFHGADQALIWGAFAESGMGRDASSAPNDTDPTPSFASPYAKNVTVTLKPKGDAATAPVRLYVGDYEARAVPVADTDPATPIPDTFAIVPGTSFDLTVTAPGFGTERLRQSFHGKTQDLRPDLSRNLASGASGATVSGDGVNLDKIVDDTEATDWASLDGVAGRQVTVALAGGRPQTVRRVNVSALLRPAITGDVDTGTQNRFSALRSFAILACDATVSDCSTDAGYHQVYRSAPDAFPAAAFRPTAPQLNLRSFDIRPTRATHLRLRVLASQCTGGPRYAGEQDNDPAATTDCATGSPFAAQVRVAEFQAFAH
ncbi:M36 family metallopeptidase [Rugosimonospora africana]|nr:M36 family metallopeptidase [Rugosimonospora africana]